MSKPHHPEYALAVDLIVLTVRGDRLQVLLIERGKPPFLGRLALPGGFMRENEDLETAAIRELFEETTVDGTGLHLEQVRTYSTLGRDPRGRVVTVGYLAVAPNLPVPVAGTDAARARWVPVDEVDPAHLAFDHAELLRDGLERARAKLEYTSLATDFCGAEFTISELRRVYEVVWGEPVDARNFQRKVAGEGGFIAPTGAIRVLDIGRPAALYRRVHSKPLRRPMLRVAAVNAL